MPTISIDPLVGPKIALRGRVVPMDAQYSVLSRGIIYIERGTIIAVQDAVISAPPGFETVPIVDTRGTIYPGLIELHNHLAYNALRLWQVPKKYGNRDQWSGIPEYRRLISGPMQIVGKTPSLLPALVRYVECKCLLGGVTTSQGIQLFSNAGVRRFYRGVVRNAEQTDEADLPEAVTRIDGVDAGNAELFLARLTKQTCSLRHLSEGADRAARDHFLALQMPSGDWAITPQLAGIHCTALTPVDFERFGKQGGDMIWSPLSNLLSYGATADVAAARAAGVRIGIGSDWSPSGSKNLLGELKVAWLWAQNMPGFSQRDIVAMATRNAAAILQWDAVLGSIEPGKRADLLVIDGMRGDPYGALIAARETAIRLVMINGVARYGSPTLLPKLGCKGETITVGGCERMLYLEQATQDPDVSDVSLRQAKVVLKNALARLPQLALELEQPKPIVRALGEPEPIVWQLALDELHDTGVDLRPRLPLPETQEITGPLRLQTRALTPLSQIVTPLVLDPLTVADDPDFIKTLSAQKNLPDWIKQGLATLL